MVPVAMGYAVSIYLPGYSEGFTSRNINAKIDDSRILLSLFEWCKGKHREKDVTPCITARHAQ